MAPRAAWPAFVAAAALGAALVYGASATLNDYLLSIVEFVGINIILAVSLNVTNGFTGLFSLGHPAFMTIGGYVTAIMSLEPRRKPFLLPDLPEWLAAAHLPFLPALVVGGLVAALVAVVVGFPVLRLRGHYLAVATLGLIFIVQGLAINLDGYTRGALGLNGLPELTNLWWVYGWMLLTLYVCWTLKHSSLGRTMLAIRENELAAACLGVRITRTRIFSFALGAFSQGWRADCGRIWSRSSPRPPSPSCSPSSSSSWWCWAGPAALPAPRWPEPCSRSPPRRCIPWRRPWDCSAPASC
jgi:branched-chain amino acid transport system permease protein